MLQYLVKKITDLHYWFGFNVIYRLEKLAGCEDYEPYDYRTDDSKSFTIYLRSADAGDLGGVPIEDRLRLEIDTAIASYMEAAGFLVHYPTDEYGFSNSLVEECGNVECAYHFLRGVIYMMDH